MACPAKEAGREVHVWSLARFRRFPGISRANDAHENKAIISRQGTVSWWSPDRIAFETGIAPDTR